jgi:hypothetical protein
VPSADLQGIVVVLLLPFTPLLSQDHCEGAIIKLLTATQDDTAMEGRLVETNSRFAV